MKNKKTIKCEISTDESGNITIALQVGQGQTNVFRNVKRIGIVSGDGDKTILDPRQIIDRIYATNDFEKL